MMTATFFQLNSSCFLFLNWSYIEHVTIDREVILWCSRINSQFEYFPDVYGLF